MSYSEIFERVYASKLNLAWSQDEIRLAKNELAHMSDFEWNDWIKYRDGYLRCIKAGIEFEYA